MGKCDTLYVVEIKFVLLQRKSLPIILDRSFFKFERIYYWSTRCYWNSILLLSETIVDDLIEI